MTRPDRYTVRNADAAIHDLLVRYRAAAAEARERVLMDPTINGDSQVGAMRTAVDAVRAQYAADLARIDQDVRGQVATLEQQAQALLPKPAAGVEALLSRQVQVARIRTLLDAGWRIADVINVATDPEQLLALADELPTMVAAGQLSFQGGLPGGQRMVTNALARLAGPTAVAALESADDAREGLAVLEPGLRQAANEIGATDHRVTSPEEYAAALDELGIRLPRR